MAETTFATPTNVADTIATPTASDVYSADNVAQTLTTPATAVDLSDPYGLYDSFLNSADIQAAKAGVTSTQADIDAVNKALRTTTTALEGQNESAMGTTGASVNLIGKQVGRARDLTSNELAALSETLSAQTANLNTLQTDAQNRYAIAQQERAQLQDLIRSTGGKAGINYTDSYEDALKKASKYEEEQMKEAEKKAYKDNLKEQLRAFGSSTKGLSKNELEKKLKKKMKQAGMADAEMKELELALKRKELNKPYYKPDNAGGDTTLKNSYTNTEQNRFIEEALAGGEDWNAIKETFIGLGIPVDEGSNMDNYLKRKFGY